MYNNLNKRKALLVSVHMQLRVLLRVGRMVHVTEILCLDAVSQRGGNVGVSGMQCCPIGFPCRDGFLPLAAETRF